MTWKMLFALVLAAAPVYAQPPVPVPDPQESRFASDLRREREEVKEGCGDFTLKGIGSCVMVLATDDPFHVAIGSLAPQNGFSLGVAFVEHYTPSDNWLLKWNADAASAFGGSWRAGAYMTIVHTGVQLPTVRRPGDPPRPRGPAVHPYPIINLYAQTTSLQKLFFSGLGPATTTAGQTVFGMRETIVGGNVIYPLTTVEAIRGMNLSLLGGVNGRFFALRGNTSESVPSIEQRFDESTAPGLGHQPGFAQLSEGVRLKPSWLDGHLLPNYLISFDQFLAGADSHASFHRWTIDLNHEVPLYGTTRSSTTKETNGPDECSESLTGHTCPAISRNRSGTVTFRVLLSGSAAAAGNTVPFYLQQTLGGSDINGNPSLSSYDDYRFRGPNLVLLQEGIEHSIWGPIGVMFLAEQGKVTLAQEDLGFGDLAHSFAAGLTLRAGGFPQVLFLFAWGGNEGHHTVLRMNIGLLGGSNRPPLD